MKNEITKSITINAPASKVWKALMNAVGSNKYRYELEVNANWKIRNPLRWLIIIIEKEPVLKGKILCIEPLKILEFSDFNQDSGNTGNACGYAKITCKLSSEKKGQTILQISDDYIGDKNKYTEPRQFWDMVLPKLKEIVEQKRYKKILLSQT